MEEKETLVRTIEALNAFIAVMSENQKREIESHKKEVDALNQRIKELTAQVAWLNRQLFGRKSERLAAFDPGQMDLFAEENAGQLRQAEEARDEAVEKIAKTPEDRRREKRNRAMMEGLPVLERVVITPEGVDASLYRKIGEEVTRVVEHKPGMLYIKEIVREKWGLKDNTALAPEGKSGVMVAPMPLLPVNKGIAGASLLADILLQKYEYHMPFYRQIKQYSHLGMKGLTESTMDGWFKQTMELLRPLHAALEAEVMKTGYAQADETTTPVVDREGHKARKEYLWMIRAVVERLVLFHYDQGSRAGAVIESLAKRHNFKGYLQCIMLPKI